MKLNFLIFLFVLVISIEFSCSRKVAFPYDQQTYISFGSLGGITGKYTEYRIFKNGQAYRMIGYNGDKVAQEYLDHKMAHQFFDVTVDIYQSTGKINEAGDLSYFIRLIEDDQPIIELIWGNNSYNVDERISSLYNTMKAVCKDQSFVR